MPFDSSPQKTLTRLDKLERLLWLAERATGDQQFYCSCLLHDAMADPLLGLPDWETCPGEEMLEWFGRDNFVEPRILFGSLPIESKRAYLRDLIARERAGKSKD